MSMRPVQSHRTPSLEVLHPGFNALMSSLKLFIIFEQETSNFHFALGPTIYVAYPDSVYSKRF